ncbi:MAG: hypothetical protein IMF07_06585, partial [Proteobacteria bacterium]|nr:hypothetical protein [Pseudomonadota bacterium]
MKIFNNLKIINRFKEVSNEEPKREARSRQTDRSDYFSDKGRSAVTNERSEMKSLWRETVMVKKWLGSILIAIAMPGIALAAGTPVGTDITNIATASYVINNATLTKSSAPVTVKVAEMIDVSVSWQDAANVAAIAGSIDQALNILVTNTGNGTETFDLSANSLLGTADFDPTLVGIFFDTNGNGNYDAGTDQQYVAGTNDPTLAADGSVAIFLVNDIPGGEPDGNVGDSRLTATSQTGSGAAGTVLAGSGDGGLDAVIGTSGGTSSVIASYVVSNTVVTV